MPLDIESIIESIEMLDRELQETKRQAKDGHLRAKPDETVIIFLILKFFIFFCFIRLIHLLLNYVLFVNK